MKKCAVAATVAALLSMIPTQVMAEPAYWSGMGTTAHEESVEACSEEDNLLEYGDGDYDQCVEEYMADLEMIPMPEQESTTTEVIMEDDPRWDCKTMGNRICGTVVNDWDGSQIQELPHTL